MEWQPIESAPKAAARPKDRVHLLWCPDSWQGCVEIGWWAHANIITGEGYWTNGETDACGEPVPPLRPTHWMPLSALGRPAPPESAEP